MCIETGEVSGSNGNGPRAKKRDSKHMAILLCSSGLQVFLLLLFTYLTLDALVSMGLT